ncbi:hypothetical protein [Streptomyces sp.]|uniref:hypothetical protein n=1 Tax=Streptomyces sp. TaxID=1931 RepID=UPI002F3E8F21
MSVNVKLVRAAVEPKPGTPGLHARSLTYLDDEATRYEYEVLPGGPLAILEIKQQVFHTKIVYAASAWIKAEGDRRGDRGTHRTLH